MNTTFGHPGIALYKNRREASHLLAFPIGEGGPRQRWIGCFRMQHKCAALFPCTTIYLSYHVCPIRSPSTVIPSAAEGSLLHCRHIHTCALTQTTPWYFLFRLSLTHDLPLCKKDPSTSVGMTGGRRIISYRFSYRCVELCLFILRLRRGLFGLTGRRLNGQARRLFGLGQTRKSLCGTSVSKGLLVSLL